MTIFYLHSHCRACDYNNYANINNKNLLNKTVIKVCVNKPFLVLDPVLNTLNKKSYTLPNLYLFFAFFFPLLTHSMETDKCFNYAVIKKNKTIPCSFYWILQHEIKHLIFPEKILRLLRGYFVSFFKAVFYIKIYRNKMSFLLCHYFR